MISYDEMKTSIDRLSKERSDVLDAFFLPMVISLHYQISGYAEDLEKGKMYLDHPKGLIVAKPDKDSSIIFYKDQTSRQGVDWDNQDEIHVYLDNNHIIVDLPRFGVTSRQSEIVFDGTEKDKSNFNNLISLIDYNVRSKESGDGQIKYMNRLQFRDDISSVINNPNEHLRFIPQVLNDSIKEIDNDLIDFFILKIKKKFDALDEEDLEEHVRDLIKSDLEKRKEQNNQFVIVEEQDQLERERKRKEKIETNHANSNSNLSLNIKEIFDNATPDKSQEEQQVAQPEEQTSEPVQKKVQPRKIIRKDSEEGEVSDGSTRRIQDNQSQGYHGFL